MYKEYIEDLDNIILQLSYIRGDIDNKNISEKLTESIRYLKHIKDNLKDK